MNLTGSAGFYLGTHSLYPLINKASVVGDEADRFSLIQPMFCSQFILKVVVVNHSDVRFSGEM